MPKPQSVCWASAVATVDRHSRRWLGILGIVLGLASLNSPRAAEPLRRACQRAPRNGEDQGSPDDERNGIIDDGSVEQVPIAEQVGQPWFYRREARIPTGMPNVVSKASSRRRLGGIEDEAAVDQGLGPGVDRDRAEALDRHQEAGPLDVGAVHRRLGERRLVEKEIG
jgi:hypothetical protein